MKRAFSGWHYLVVLMWVVSAALAANAVRLWKNSPVQRPPSNPAIMASLTPYMVRLKETISTATDSKAGVEKILALRGDGSTVEWVTFAGKQKVLSQRSLKLSSGQFVATDEILEQRYSVETRVDLKAGQPDPSTGCLRTYGGDATSQEDGGVGHESIAGHRTTQVKTGNTTKWLAVDLGCAPLRIRVQFTDSRSEQVAVELVAGEPPAVLFDVSPRFKEVPVAALHRRPAAD